MIFKNMEALGIEATKQVVKIGDTTSDIKEALNAGVWAVGVIVGSSEMGLSEEEFMALSEENQQIAIEKQREYLKKQVHIIRFKQWKSCLYCWEK